MFDRQSIHVALLVWGCIFCLIAALCMYMSTQFERHRRRWLLGLQLAGAALMASDAAAWAYRGAPGVQGWWMVRVSNFLVFLLTDLVLLLFHGYLCTCLFEQDHRELQDTPGRRIAAVYLLAAVGAALVIVSQFTGLYYSFDAENFYHRASFYPLSVLLPLCGALVDASLILQYRSRLSRQAAVSLLSYIVLPVAAAVTLLFYYGISLINIAISISMVFLFISAITEQDRRIAAQEQQLTESRISIMLSQMQPHFMYNVLNSIYYLCESDPERARDAIDKFSSYLRSNMSALEQTEQISFAEEYRHIRTYLELEQMRFGQKLQVEYDISVSGFRVPPLTVQPLVENAVRHGVTKKRGGGTELHPIC